MSPACLSNFTLDRLAAGALPEMEAAAAQRHIDGCSGCAERMKLRTFAGLPEVDPARALQRIEARLAAEQPARGPRAWLRWPLLAPLAAAAAVLLLIARPSPRGPAAPPRDPGATREKGAAATPGLVLHVHRARGAASEALPSGAAVAPGDRLRFVVDLPAPGHIGIVGVQADGALYTAWPLGEAETLRPAGADQLLPGVAVRDDQKGRETLYLVHCPGARPSCTTQGAQRAPACPAGCQLAPFILGEGG